MKATFFALLLVSFLSNASRADEGEEYTVGISASGPTQEGLLINEFETAMTKQDKIGARNALQKLLALDENHPDTLVVLGKFEYQFGNYEQARAYLEKAAVNWHEGVHRAGSSHRDLHYSLGKTYQVLGQNEKAIEHYRKLRPAGGFRSDTPDPDLARAAERIMTLTGTCKIDEVVMLDCKGSSQEAQPGRMPASH